MQRIQLAPFDFGPQPLGHRRATRSFIVHEPDDDATSGDDTAATSVIAEATNSQRSEALDPLKANRAYMLLDDESSEAGQLLRAHADNAKVAEQLAISLEGDAFKAAVYVGAVGDFLEMAPELTKEAV